MNVTIPELADWLKGFDDIAVFGHRAPDGDACGSCAAVTLALRALGKRACACLPGGMPEYLRFLPGQECVVADGNLPFAPRCALAEPACFAERPPFTTSGGRGTACFRAAPPERSFP